MALSSLGCLVGYAEKTVLLWLLVLLCFVAFFFFSFFFTGQDYMVCLTIFPLHE